MGKFRMSDKSVCHYDDSADREKLYDKSLDIIDRKAWNDSWIWVALWVTLQDIFSKDQPSLNQIKIDLKNLLSN